jgi:hypothetical protein
MDARFRVVVRWAALILLGVAAGGLTSWVGVGSLAVLTGAVVAFVMWAFVGATIWASYLRSDQQGALLGPGLFRAVNLGFFAAGVIVGAATFVSAVAVAIAGAAGLVAILLTRERGRSTEP